MSEDPKRHLQLTSALDPWDITLHSGDVLRVFAHGYSSEGEAVVFTALMEGNPRFLVEVLRVPESIVEKVRGGWPEYGQSG